MLTAELINGSPITKFEEVYDFETETTQADSNQNALVKELFIDYAEHWNRQRRGDK